MSLLKTAQSTDNGVLRLTSYQRSRRDVTAGVGGVGGGHVDRAVALFEQQQQRQQQQQQQQHHSPQHHNQISDSTTARYSADGEVNSLFRYGSTDEYGDHGGHAFTSPSSSPSNHHYNRRSNTAQHHGLYHDQRQALTPPPASSSRHFSFSPPLRSPTKSSDSAERRRRAIALNNPMSIRTMEVGRTQIQNDAPLSPPSSRAAKSSLSPTRQPNAYRMQKRPTLGTFGSLDKVDISTHGHEAVMTSATLPTSNQKTEAYERASKLLKKVDASKQAAEKVERAREQARLAMEKAKRAKAAKERAMNLSVGAVHDGQRNDDKHVKVVSKGGSRGYPSARDPPATVQFEKSDKRTLRFADQVQQEHQQMAARAPPPPPPPPLPPSRQRALIHGDDQDVESQSIDDIRIPHTGSSFTIPEEAWQVQFPDEDSTVKDRYNVDDGRYEVQAEEDVIDDVLEYEASKRRAQARIEAPTLPPLSPTHQDNRTDNDDLDDLMDFAEGMLGGKQKVKSRNVSSPKKSSAWNEAGEMDELVADACSFTEELSCGSEKDLVAITSEPEVTAKRPEPMKRYPMQNAAILERVMEEKGIQTGPAPPLPPPEVTDTVAYRVQKNVRSNEKPVSDNRGVDDDASHGDELDDIMNFAAGLLGSKASIPKETKMQTPTVQMARGKQKGKPVVQNDAANEASQNVSAMQSKKKAETTRPQQETTIPNNLGGDDLDDIMDLAAGLLGGKAEAITPKASNQRQSLTFSKSASSIVAPVYTSQAIPKKKAKKPQKVEETSCCQDACSVWSDEFFRSPEEEVVFNSSDRMEQPTLLKVAKDNDRVSKTPLDFSPLPPPPEAFNLKPVQPDDCSARQSLPNASVNQVESPLADEFTGAVTANGKTIPASHAHAMAMQRNNQSVKQAATAANDNPSRDTTLLDSNDDYWDTLSTIASGDLSVNRRVHPKHATQKEPEEVPLDSLQEGAPFGALLCGWLGMERRNMATKKLNPSKATDTFGNTLVSTEGSVVAAIPKVIEYPTRPRAVDEEEHAQTSALNNVQTLITKGSSDGSNASDTFTRPDGLNSVKAKSPEHNVDNAILRGQKMAEGRSSRSNVAASRYGNDQGDEPLGSPSHLSHDSKSSPVSVSSRKVVSRKHPWNKSGNLATPYDKFQSINGGSDPQIATEDSELAAMLGIKKIVSAEKVDDANEPYDSRPYGVVSGSQDSDDVSDLLMVLTRSAGDDDVLETTPSQLDSNDHGPMENARSSPTSGKVEDILLSLKRAETMGHDERSIEFISPASSNLGAEGGDHVSSPKSPKRQGFKPEDNWQMDMKNQKARTSDADNDAVPRGGFQQLENAQWKRAQDNERATSNRRSKQESGDTQIMQKDASCPMVDVLFDDYELLPHERARELEEAQNKRTQAGDRVTSERPAPTKQTNEIVPQDNGCPVVDVLFDDDDEPPTGKGVQQLEVAQKKRTQAGDRVTSKRPAPAKQASQIVQQDNGCPVVDVLFDDDDEPSPGKGVQQLKVAEKKRTQANDRVFSKRPASTKQAKETNEIVQSDNRCPVIDVLLDDGDEPSPGPGVWQLEQAQRKRTKGHAPVTSKRPTPAKTTTDIVKHDDGCPVIDVLCDDDEPLPGTGVQQLEKAQQKRVHVASSSKAVAKHKNTESLHGLIEKENGCPMVDVLFEDEQSLPRMGNPQFKTTQQQRELSSVSKQWKLANDAANVAAAKEAANAAAAKELSRQKNATALQKQEGSSPVIDVLFDEDDPLPITGVDQLEKAQQKRQKVEATKNVRGNKQETSSPMSPREHELQMAQKQASCEMFQVLLDEDGSIPQPGNEQSERVRREGNQGPKETPQNLMSVVEEVFAEELGLNDMQVPQSPTDSAVRLSPIKSLRVTPDSLQKADDISSVSSSKSPETTQVMKDLLAQYDSIIAQLIREKSGSRENEMPDDSADDAQRALRQLRHKRDYALGSGSQKDQKQDFPLSPPPISRSLSPVQEEEPPSPRLNRSPTRSRSAVEPSSPGRNKSPAKSADDHVFISRAIGKKSAAKSPRSPPSIKTARDHVSTSLAVGKSSQTPSSPSSPKPAKSQVTSSRTIGKASATTSQTTSSTNSVKDKVYTSRAGGKTSVSKSPTSPSLSQLSASRAGVSTPTHSASRQHVSTRREDFSPGGRSSTSALQSSKARASASPTRSPRRQSQESVPSRDFVSPTRANAGRYEAKPLVSPRTKISTGYSSHYDSPKRGDAQAGASASSDLRRSKMQPPDIYASPPLRTSHRTATSSPTRSPRRQRSAYDMSSQQQSRDVTTPTRSTGRQERASPSPRRSSSTGRSAPRPEDKIQQLRRERARALSPKRQHLMDPFVISSSASSSSDCSRKSRGGPESFRESRESKNDARRGSGKKKRTYSTPERQRHLSRYDSFKVNRKKSLFVDTSFEDNDEDDQQSQMSEYGMRSREIRDDLEMARMASESIRHSHEELFDEMGVFQDKLLRHSRRNNCEREFISESRRAVGDLQHRLERVRRESTRMSSRNRRNGRETPDTLDHVEHALEEAWGDFDNVRGTMLNNLKLLNQAKEELMRERLKREEENDDEQLRMLEGMIQEIRHSQHYKAGGVLDSIRESKSSPYSIGRKYKTMERPTFVDAPLSPSSMYSRSIPSSGRHAYSGDSAVLSPYSRGSGGRSRYSSFR